MRYFEVVKGMSMKNRFDLRLRMVKMAEERGIKETARLYNTTRNTVRKWLYRYRKEGLNGLKERSRAPKSIPHKIPQGEEDNSDEKEGFHPGVKIG